MKLSLSAILPKHSHEDTTRYFVLLIINLLAALYGFIYAGIAFYELLIPLATINTIMGFVFLGILVFAYRNPMSKYTYISTLIICSLFFSYLYVSGGANGSGYIWSLILPTGSYLMVGKKRGTIVSISFLLGLSIITATDFVYHISFLKLPETHLAIRIISVFMLQTIIAFSFEYSREKYLTESKDKDELLKEITDTIPGMVYQYKLLSNGLSMFPYASHMIEELLEVKAEDIKYDASLVLNRIHPDDAERVMKSIMFSKEHISLWNQDFRMILPQKGLVWIHGVSMPQICNDGSVIWNGHLFDITTHKIFEEKFSAVFNSMNELVVMHQLVFDNTGKAIDYIITDCNEAFLNSTGLQKDSIIGKRATQVYNTASAPYIDTYAPIAMSNTSTKFTTYYEPMNKYFSISVVSHKPNEFVTITSDITEQKFEESHRKKLQEQLELAIKGSNDGIWDWNIKTDELYISPRWKEMLGYEDKELTNHLSTFSNLIFEEDAQRVAQYIQSYLEGHVPQYELDFRMKHKDGSLRWILAKGEALRDHEGKPYRMAGSHTDITHIKQQQEELLKEQKFLEALLEAIPIPVFYKDKDGKYLGFNKAFEHLFEKTKEELIGKTVYEVNPKEYAEVYDAKDKDILEKGGIQVYESTIKHKDNSTSEVIFYKSVFTDANNNTIGIIGAILDVTETNQIEQRFRKMFDTMNSGIAIYKPINNGDDFIFLDFNKAAEEITQSNKEDIIGSTLVTQFPNMKQSKLYEALQEVYATGKDIYIPPFFYKDNKREGWRENYIFKLSSGELVAMFTDVTDKMNSEQLIRHERERLQNIIAGTNAATWEWNIQTGETIFNERWAEMIGYSLEDISPTTIHTWMQFAHPDDIQTSNTLIQKHFNGEIPFYEFESRMFHKSGDIVWVLDRGKVTKWTDDGKPLIMSGTHQDITARKTIEKQLSDSQQEFKHLFEKSPTSIILHNSKTGEIIHANEAALESYEVHSLQELQENMFWVESPYSQTEALKMIHKTLETGQHSFEWKSRKVSGEYFWQLITLNTFIYKEELCIIATAIDITLEHTNKHLLELTSETLQILNQPQGLEQILQQTIETIQQKLECSAIGIRLENNEDFPYIVTKGFSKEFLEKEQSLLAKNPDGSIVYQSPDKPCLECTCGLVIRGPVPKNHELFTEHGSFYTKKSNEILTIPRDQDPRFQARNTCIHFGYKTFALIPIKHNSKVIGLLHIASEKHHYFSDQIIASLEILVTHISETIIRKKIEQEMLAAKESAEEATKTKSMFLANMSHEIRTPLNAIVGFSEILHNSQLSPKQKEFSDIIHISSKTLLDLVNDILDFSKIEAGKLDLQLEKTDIIQTVESIVDIIKLKLKESNIELITNISPQVPQFVHIDPLRIRQVLLNLLNNASKFTHKGTIEICIQCVEKKSNKGIFTFSIHDTGIGIAPDKQAQIFEAFTQADNSTTRTYGGTGLGLAISSNIIKKMGSHIELQSTPNIGSTFSFTVELEFEESPAPSYTCTEKISHILLIDDNERVHAMLQEQFSQFGIACDFCTDGLSAIKLVEQNNYEVILVDLHLPYIDGLQVIESIRKIKKNIAPNCIVLKEYDEQTIYTEKFEKLSIAASIDKPIRIHELWSTLEQLYSTKKVELLETINSDIITPIENSHTILIVDDNTFNLVLAQAIVMEYIPNASIVQAVNGQDAVEKFQQQAFDLILMDIQMPVMNGYEATRMIRSIELKTHTHTPIIAISAGTISGEKDKSKEAGMDTYIPKPIEPKLLKHIFDTYLLKKTKITETPNIHDVLANNETTTKHFDSDMAFEKYANKKFIAELVHMAIESIPEYISQLHKAIEDNDKEQIRFCIHTIKGIARGIYFNVLYEICLTIEKDTNSDIEILTQQIQNLTQEFDYLTKNYTNF